MQLSIGALTDSEDDKKISSEKITTSSYFDIFSVENLKGANAIFIENHKGTNTMYRL